jgi:hypothetical protein
MTGAGVACVELGVAGIRSAQGAGLRKRPVVRLAEHTYPRVADMPRHDGCIMVNGDMDRPDRTVPLALLASRMPAFPADRPIRTAWAAAPSFGANASGHVRGYDPGRKCLSKDRGEVPPACSTTHSVPVTTTPRSALRASTVCMILRAMGTSGEFDGQSPIDSCANRQAVGG